MAGRGAATSTIRVLHVEDDPVQRALVQRLLASAGGKFNEMAVGSLAEALIALATDSWDVCLLDLGLPDSVGLGTLRRVLAKQFETPVVVLTGESDPWLALAAIKMGAQDFLIKGHIDVQGLSRTLTFAWARKFAESPAAAAEPAAPSGFEPGSVFDSVPLPIAVVDGGLHLRHANKAWLACTGSDGAGADGAPVAWLELTEDQAFVQFDGKDHQRRLRVRRAPIQAMPGCEAVCLVSESHAAL